MNSNTAVTDYMNMPILRFFETCNALHAVMERQRQAMKDRQK